MRLSSSGVARVPREKSLTYLFLKRKQMTSKKKFKANAFFEKRATNVSREEPGGDVLRRRVWTFEMLIPRERKAAGEGCLT